MDAPQCLSTQQSLVVANKTVFWNCLVIMRLKTLLVDLPRTHDITVHLRNEFVTWIKHLNADIEMS